MILIVWDNGGKTFDRYTVRIRNDYFTMSSNASSPQGVNQYAASYPDMNEKQLGKRILQKDYRNLPESLRIAIGDRT